MSAAKDTESDKAVNIEGILADFFLNKMNGSKYKSHSYEKKRKKNKKHKSKKSKHKRSSSEEKPNYRKCTIDHSSSEEKDIKRLQRLKRLDTKDNLNVSSLTSSAVTDNNDLKIKLESCNENDLFYGPSLETLLGISTNVNNEENTAEVKNTSNDKSNTAKVYNETNNEENNVGVEIETSEDVKNSASLDKSKTNGSDNENSKAVLISSTIKRSSNDLEVIKRKKKRTSDKYSKSRSRSRSADSDKRFRSNKRLNKPLSRSRSKSKSRRVKNRSRSRSYSHSKKSYRSRSRSKDLRYKSYSRSNRSRSLSKRRKRSRSRSGSRSQNLSKSQRRYRSRSRSYERSRRSRDRGSRYKSYKERGSSFERESRRRKRSRSKSGDASRKKGSRSRSTSGSRRKRSRSKSTSAHRRKHSHSKSKDVSPRKHSRSRSNSAGRKKRSCSKSKDVNKIKHSRSRSTSRDRRRRSRSKSKDASRKKRSRSRSSDKRRRGSNSLKIDQAKIREIAQKNVLSMIEKGTLPEGLSIDNFKKEQLASLKAGGKSVQELTDFCAKLSKRENEPITENKDSTENNTDSAFIHHPFKLKEVSAIKLNIRNSIQIPVKTHAEKVAETARLSSQFPVSSGNKHKQKELEWIPVEPDSKTSKDSDTSKTLVPLSQTTKSVSTIPNKKTPEAITAPLPPEPAAAPLPLPPPPPPPPETAVPALPPPPLPPPIPPSGLLSLTSAPAPQQPQVAMVDYPMIPTSNYSYGYSVMPEMSNYNTKVQYPNIITTAEQSIVFPVTTSHSIQTSSHVPKKLVDVSSVVAQRFKAITKLQTNPNDIEALRSLEEAQSSINDWVQSQEVPGLFTGSTGAKLLSVEELSGPRHWVYKAKKDIFTRAAPVTGGKGMSLLKKMGWNPGEGLGKNKEGSLEPLVLDIKTDKKGLVSEGEGNKKLVSSVVKDLQGKHPVSALMELCSKRKWKPPLYTLIQDSGPSHKKLFLFKVEVNNVEYQAATPTSNKKVAKADAAVICLQALSVYPAS